MTYIGDDPLVVELREYLHGRTALRPQMVDELEKKRFDRWIPWLRAPGVTRVPQWPETLEDVRVVTLIEALLKHEARKRHGGAQRRRLTDELHTLHDLTGRESRGDRRTHSTSPTQMSAGPPRSAEIISVPRHPGRPSPFRRLQRPASYYPLPGSQD